MQLRQYQLRIVHIRRLFLSVLFLLATVSSSVVAQNASAFGDVTTFVARDYSFEGPEQISPGWHAIQLRNEGAEPHHVQFARLNDGVSTDQFFSALREEGEGWESLVTLNGGVSMTQPGTTNEALVDFTNPGTYVLLCFLPNAEGVPHLVMGMTGVLEVSGEPNGVAEPRADVEIHMKDFAYTLPASIQAGPTIWKVVNDGPQPHEMTVVKLDDGVSVDDFVTYVTQNGPADIPGTSLGGVQGLQEGLASYLSYDLEPGEYVVLCDVPDSNTGMPHFMLGMVAGFTVEEAN